MAALMSLLSADNTARSIIFLKSGQMPPRGQGSQMRVWRYVRKQVALRLTSGRRSAANRGTTRAVLFVAAAGLNYTLYSGSEHLSTTDCARARYKTWLRRCQHRKLTK
ncbi:hypothetical protein J6590_021471 [Homalodisca vitripennis]|nr:hypothetical protein J6590_021471 [Homalodisca vitripennis]